MIENSIIEKTKDTAAGRKSEPTVAKASEKKAPSQKYSNRKVDLDSAKVLNSFRDKVNKKSYGRKIRDPEILAKAISLLESKHMLELQEATFSEQDRLHMAHDEYTKAHGKISLDQFIGKLLKGELKLI